MLQLETRAPPSSTNNRMIRSAVLFVRRQRCVQPTLSPPTTHKTKSPLQVSAPPSALIKRLPPARARTSRSSDPE